MSLGIKISITVLEGDDAGKSFSIVKPRTVLGRSRGDIILADKKISSEHLCFIVEEGQLFVEDLASTNGTYVNDERIEKRTALNNLDELAIGFSKCRINIVEDLQAFKKVNSVKTPPPKKVSNDDTGEFKVKGSGTGINKLIDEELKRFSRWDLSTQASAPSFSKSLQLPKVPIELHILEGPEQGRCIRLPKGNSVLGRGKADISFKDNDISRNHASIETFTEKQIFIRDMASTNGTLVNKKRISYTKLEHGDIIQMGSTVMRFVVGDDQGEK